MNITNIIVLMFLLGAFAIGINLSGESEWSLVDASLNNASQVIQNFTLTYQTTSSISGIDMHGFYLVLEKYVHFIGTFALEIMRAGIKFGFDNPSYFTPENIFYLMKLIIVLVILSLLIKPLFYVLIFIIMGFIWLKDKLKRKKKK